MNQIGNLNGVASKKSLQISFWNLSIPQIPNESSRSAEVAARDLQLTAFELLQLRVVEAKEAVRRVIAKHRR